MLIRPAPVGYLPDGTPIYPPGAGYQPTGAPGFPWLLLAVAAVGLWLLVR